MDNTVPSLLEPLPLSSGSSSSSPSPPSPTALNPSPLPSSFSILPGERDEFLASAPVTSAGVFSVGGDGIEVVGRRSGYSEESKAETKGTGLALAGDQKLHRAKEWERISNYSMTGRPEEGKEGGDEKDVQEWVGLSSHVTDHSGP